MRRLLIFIIFFVLSSLACQTVMGRLPSLLENSTTPTANFIGEPQSAGIPSQTPSTGLPATVSPTILSPMEPPLEPTDKPLTPLDSTPMPNMSYQVRFHPDGPLYLGDQISIEVIAGKNIDLSGSKDDKEKASRMKVSVEETGEYLGEATFERFGIGGRQQATLTWVWDTAGLEPGEHKLVFNAEPEGKTWMETIILLPSSLVPYPEPQARWETVTSDCCIYYYITGSKAERDLEDLIEITEKQAQLVRQQLSSDFNEKVAITFLPRVLGHGGFAGEEISISYLDRNYAGRNLEMVLHHEMVHILDSRLGGKLRPSLFIEGFAVYLSGGHFKEEPLIERAAALLPAEPDCLDASQAPAGQSLASNDAPLCSLNQYIPLHELFDNFYFSQHEIGYLQAGALVEFIVNRWGWEAFEAFYRDIQPVPDDEEKSTPNRPSEAVDNALKTHFNLSLDMLEVEFLAALEEITLTTQWLEDVRMVIAFYDTVRRYQQALDPSAFFLYAWLPGNQAMRDAGIVADYLRTPNSAENIIIEGLLVQADEALKQGQYSEVQHLLDTVNQQLDFFSLQKAAD